MVVTWYRESSSKPVAEDRFSIGRSGTPEAALIAAARKGEKKP
jgi:hypothetical protein